MELCEVGSLQDIITKRNKGLAEAFIAPIMKQTLQGLIYLHANNKIHRDIKSGTVILPFIPPSFLDWSGSKEEDGVSLFLSRMTLPRTPTKNS
jgi:serine/threonine protein kinase